MGDGCFCDDCGSTNTKEITITEWEENKKLKYEEKGRN